jgi:hypothetical protein
MRGQAAVGPEGLTWHARAWSLAEVQNLRTAPEKLPFSWECLKMPGLLAAPAEKRWAGLFQLE